MMASTAANEKEPCQLYLITPPQIDDLDAFATTLESVLKEKCVACVQLRLKGVDDAEIIAAAKKLMPICHDYDVAFLINDRVDIAADIDADGVHIGQHDGDVQTARALLGPDREIGVTCHDSRHLAFEAGEAGANYVAFGAFFPTKTKETDARPDPEILTMWDEVTDLPSVAIGGITVENCKILADSGAHFVAVSSGVWQHPDGPVAAVRKFSDILGLS